MSVDEDKLQELRDTALKAVEGTAAAPAVRECLEAYDAELGDSSERVEELEGENEDSREREAIDAFCDVVERTVGKLTFIVPQSAEVDRAILGLHDAIGRSL